MKKTQVFLATFVSILVSFHDGCASSTMNKSVLKETYDEINNAMENNKKINNTLKYIDTICEPLPYTKKKSSYINDLNINDVITFINNGDYENDVEESQKKHGRYLPILNNAKSNENLSEDAIRFALDELHSYYIRSNIDIK